MDRREFLAKVGIAATWAAIPVTLAACGDDDNDKAPTNPDGGGNDEDIDGVVTGGGHSHSLVITHAQLIAEQAVALTMTGNGHTHTVNLTGAEVGNIADGQKVVKTSSTDGGHSHTATFN